MSENLREVYLDHAATTYLDPRVKLAMEPYYEAHFGNPSSLYRAGQRAKKALDESRATIAHVLHCQPSEIIFTSGGTESDNLAILGVCKALEAAQLSKMTNDPEMLPKAAKWHLVTTQIEHDAVLEPCRYLESQGYDVTYLPVDADGLVDAESVRSAIRDNTLLVSVMYANNEVGTIQPIQEISRICKEKRVYFHTDACQAAGALSLNVTSLGVDLMTLNSSKIYGPKGVGLLYVKQGVKIQPLMYGGGQEMELRSGTENVPGIVGFAKALYLIDGEKNAENKRLLELRQFLLAGITKRIFDVKLNGHPTKRLPNNLNVSIPGLDGESFVLAMDAVGIACATGSACKAASGEPSHVLLALDNSIERAQSSIRFTLGKRTSKSDLEYVLKQISVIVNRLRK